MIEQPLASSKPALDEESFTRLLAAAYVMQEHHDRVRAKVSPADLTQIISQVVETQHEIGTRSLGTEAAFDLIAKRLCSVSGAAGVSIAALSGDTLHYFAGAGSGTVLVRTEVAKQASLGATCLKTGTTFQSPLAQTDPRLNGAQCRKLGAQSLLTVPLYHDGQVAGLIEMYFSQVSGFGESETRAAELMAGVASEVIADAAENELKQELESERASVMQALEMLEPELQKMTAEAEPDSDLAPPAESALCRACGHAFIGNENSCGVCGASRETGMYPGAALQSKWAILWERHLTGAEQNGMPLFRRTPPEQSVVPADKLAFNFHRQEPAVSSQDLEPLQSSSLNDSPPEEEPEAVAAVTAPVWNSVSQAQEQPSFNSSEEHWSAPLTVLKSRPGDASLVLAALVLLMTLVWAFWPRTENASLAIARPPANISIKRRPRPKAPKLSLLEEAMVGLGLAVPPPTPEYMGDPNVKVWEDLQTGLYYCPDADLYGTTPKGRFTTQADAQQDAFDPAFRKPCD